MNEGLTIPLPSHFVITAGPGIRVQELLAQCTWFYSTYVAFKKVKRYMQSRCLE